MPPQSHYPSLCLQIGLCMMTGVQYLSSQSAYLIRGYFDPLSGPLQPAPPAHPLGPQSASPSPMPHLLLLTFSEWGGRESEIKEKEVELFS